MAKNKLKYPLEQVLEIKLRRVDQAEKIVKEKQEVYNKELEKLEGYEKAYKKILEHKNEKVDQLRDALDEGAKAHKIGQIRDYIKEVKEKVYEEQRKVERQKKQVEKAKNDLDAAQKVLKERRLEVDKLNTHKEEWLARERKVLMKEEAKLQDEIGSLVFLSNRMKEKDAEKKKLKRRRKS